MLLEVRSLIILGSSGEDSINTRIVYCYLPMSGFRIQGLLHHHHHYHNNNNNNNNYHINSIELELHALIHNLAMDTNMMCDCAC